MGEFLSYSIVSGLFMLSMFLAYKVFLARENQHGYNRNVLLTIYLVAFAMLPLTSLIHRIMVSETQPSVPTEGNGFAGTVTTVTSNPIWGTVLIWVFIAGMAIAAVKTFITWVRLMAVICSGEKIVQEGYTFVLTDNERFAPFSWVKYIVISRSDYEYNRPAIAAHEKKHIACRHWIDLLIAQVVCIINWFNPAAWLMREELMLVHEYQADMAVIDSGHNPQEYQMLLIKKAVGERFPSLANSLNHSKLKKRITMMYKEKSGVGRKLKALTLVPMFALALSVVAVPAVSAAISTISNSKTSVGKGSENLSQDEITVQNFKVTNLNNEGNETTVVIKGENFGKSLTVSGGTFTTMGKTYRAKSLQCDMTDGNAAITVKFPFISEYENTCLQLTVNGKEVMFDLEDFFNNAQSVAVGYIANPDSSSRQRLYGYIQTVVDNTSDPDSSSKATIVVNLPSSSLPSDFEIYLDGKKISHSEMEKLPPNNILSITVDKKSKTMRITTKN